MNHPIRLPSALDYRRSAAAFTAYAGLPGRGVRAGTDRYHAAILHKLERGESLGPLDTATLSEALREICEVVYAGASAPEDYENVEALDRVSDYLMHKRGSALRERYEKNAFPTRPKVQIDAVRVGSYLRRKGRMRIVMQHQRRPPQRSDPYGV